MAKVLPLEGPHKKHHNHGDTASVPMRGKGPATPNKHWEMEYDMCQGAGHNSPATAFLPKRSKDRPQPHYKINDTDN